MWKLRQRYRSFAVQEYIDPKRCESIWQKIRNLILQESSTHRTQLHIYEQRKTVRFSESNKHGSIISANEDGTDCNHLNESRNPPYENSILYEFISNYGREQITNLQDRIVTTINSKTNQAAYKTQRYRVVVENGM